MNTLPALPHLRPIPERAHARKKVMLRGLAQTGVRSSEGVAVVTDVSLSGAFIETQASPTRGSRMWLSVELKDGSVLSSYVEVVRVTARGIGARFIRLDPDAREQLLNAA